MSGTKEVTRTELEAKLWEEVKGGHYDTNSGDRWVAAVRLLHESLIVSEAAPASD